MDTNIQNHTLTMLLRGKVNAFRAISQTLTGVDFEPWQAFVGESAQELAKALFAERGQIVPARVDAKLTPAARDLWNKLVKEQFETTTALTLKDFEEQGERHKEAYRVHVIKVRSQSNIAKMEKGEMCSDDYNSSMRKTMNGLDSIGQSGNSKLMADVAARAKDKALKIMRGEMAIQVRTGFSYLDREMLLMQGEVLCIGGNAKRGKTSLAMAIALNIARECKKDEYGGVVIFSQEMTQEKLVLRLAAADTRISLKDFMQGKIKEDSPDGIRFLAAIDEIGTLPIVVDDRAGMTATKMLEVMEEYHGEFGAIRLIVDDYSFKGKPDGKTNDERGFTKAIFSDFANLIKNWTNPDGSHPAGIMIHEVNKDAVDIDITESDMSYAGQYEVGAFIVPIVPDPDHMVVQEMIEARDGVGIREDERWVKVILNRNGSPTTIDGMRFVDELTRWEQGVW